MLLSNAKFFCRVWWFYFNEHIVYWWDGLSYSPMTFACMILCGIHKMMMMLGWCSIAEIKMHWNGRTVWWSSEHSSFPLSPPSLTPFPIRWIIWSAPFEYVNARREGERGKNWMKTFLSLPFCSIHFTVTRKHRYKAVNLLRSMVYIAIILKTLCACCCFQFFCLFVFVIDLCMHTQTYLRTRTNSSSKTLYRIMWTFS